MTGKVKLVKDVEQISDSFKKRTLIVIDESSQYPQFISFEAVQDKVSILDGVNPGEEVEVSFNLRGREWTAPDGQVKYFNTLNAWRVSKVGQAQPAAAPAGAAPAPTTSDLPPLPEVEDDLPF